MGATSLTHPKRSLHTSAPCTLLHAHSDCTSQICSASWVILRATCKWSILRRCQISATKLSSVVLHGKWLGIYCNFDLLKIINLFVVLQSFLIYVQEILQLLLCWCISFRQQVWRNAIKKTKSGHLGGSPARAHTRETAPVISHPISILSNIGKSTI